MKSSRKRIRSCTKCGGDFIILRIPQMEEENCNHLVMTENAAIKTKDDTASISHLKMENHRQDLVPKVYGTRQDQEMQSIIQMPFGDESVPSPSALLPSCSVVNKSSQSSCGSSLHGLNSENLSCEKERNMKELKMERVRSWLRCNPNSEEFPSSEGEGCVVSSEG